MPSQRHKPAGPTSEREIPDAVLDATRSAVLAVGVRRTTLTDVAKRAGVSRMTLYRLVPDVTTLILEVMSREFATLLTDAERAATRKRNARARLATTSVAVVRRLPDEALFRRVLDVDPELLLPYLTDRIGTTQQIAMAHVRRMLADGQADGSVRRGNLDVMATSLVVMATPFVVSSRLLDGVGRDGVLTELERAIDRWLAP